MSQRETPEKPPAKRPNTSNTPLKGEPSKPPRSQSEIRKVFEGAPRRRLEGWQEIQEAAFAENPGQQPPTTICSAAPEIAALVSDATIEHRRTPPG